MMEDYSISFPTDLLTTPLTDPNNSHPRRLSEHPPTDHSASSTMAPTWSHASATRTSYTLHQIAPYIGRMKASMARHLVEQWTIPGDLVVDPFCGCGTVAVEAAASGRPVVAADWNPYAAVLTRAKMYAPPSIDAAERRLNTIWDVSRKRFAKQDLRRVPPWIRAFFHPQTLKSALAFRDACVYLDDAFCLSCLLGILHHQRPGFLSFPSSHLVPYLRDRNFPRATHPSLYEPRAVLPRLLRKVRRTYRRVPLPYSVHRTTILADARALPQIEDIRAVITSPPYMNELDYVRDNRLRLWFIDRALPRDIELTGANRIHAFTTLMKSVCLRLSPSVSVGGRFVLVVGDATRGAGKPGRTGDLIRHLFATEPSLQQFAPEASFEDIIPDIRRSRRQCSGTKNESILVYRKDLPAHNDNVDLHHKR